MRKALVQYAEGQTDDDGRPVGTEPFTVDFEIEDGQTVIESIADTGSVQFDWILLSA